MNHTKEIIAKKRGAELFWKVEEAAKAGKISRRQTTAIYKSWLKSHKTFPPATKSVPYTIQQKYVSQRAYDNKYKNPGYRFVEKTPDEKILVEYKVTVNPDDIEEKLKSEDLI